MNDIEKANEDNIFLLAKNSKQRCSAKSNKTLKGKNIIARAVVTNDYTPTPYDQISLALKVCSFFEINTDYENNFMYLNLKER